LRFSALGLETQLRREGYRRLVRKPHHEIQRSAHRGDLVAQLGKGDVGFSFESGVIGISKPK
jgi:hypothetical protein